MPAMQSAQLDSNTYPDSGGVLWSNYTAVLADTGTVIGAGSEKAHVLLATVVCWEDLGTWNLHD